MRFLRRSPTSTAAAGFAAAGVGVAVAWIFVPALQAWGPNITTSAITIAVTITVVDRIVRREAALRLLPRTSEALIRLKQGLEGVLKEVAFDYTIVHHRTDPVLPDNWLSVLDAWLAGRSVEDRAMASSERSGLEDYQRPYATLAESILFHAKLFRRHLVPDREVLDPLLVGAAEMWFRANEHLKAVFHDEYGAEPEEADLDLAVTLSVSRLRILVAVIGEQERSWLEIPREVKEDVEFPGPEELRGSPDEPW